MLCSGLIPLVVLFGAVVLGQTTTTVTTITKTTPKAPTKVTTRGNIEALCFPTDTAGNPFPDAPCNQIGNLTSICYNASMHSKSKETPPLKSFSEQQKCFCDPESPGAYLFEVLEG